MSRGHSAEEEQVNSLLEAEALLLYETGDDILNVDTTVIELSVAVVRHTLSGIEHFYGADIGEAGYNAVSVNISETTFNVVLCV